tara:strand:+ start:1163 stop:1375 length:213 start_codon:yes stop_codon:yes gene_type:complete
MQFSIFNTGTQGKLTLTFVQSLIEGISVLLGLFPRQPQPSRVVWFDLPNLASSEIDDVWTQTPLSLSYPS